MLKFPAYPIDEVSPEISEALARGDRVLLSTPPGSGKTTIVPLKLLNESWLAGRKIILLQPRRLAARNVAMRMAELLGEKVGETVGYRIRLESRVSSRSRIEVMTEGILLRRLQTDPELADVGLIILDEFHERSLNTDLCWVFLREVSESFRPDLRLMLMSATVHADGLPGLGPFIRISGTGRLFPVEIRELDVATPETVPQLTASAVRLALAESEGNILVFLPGRREIRRCSEILGPSIQPTSVIEELFGELPYADQQRAILPDEKGRRKIILSTPIAETSITIEGVTAVVDSGYERVSSFDPGRGADRLLLQRISMDSAAQRTGRAGRLSAGKSYRLWRGALPFQSRVPEILRSDLSSLVLELAAWGLRDSGKLPWIDPPPTSALNQARTLLVSLGFLQEDGLITDAGRRAVSLPVTPRLAAMLLQAGSDGSLRDACHIATLLGERDFYIGREVGLEIRLDILKSFRTSTKDFPAVDRRFLERLLLLSENLFRSVKKETLAYNRTVSPGELLAYAYPDRIGKRRTSDSGERRFLLSSGMSVELPQGDSLQRHPFLVVADYSVRNEDSPIRLAATITEEEIRRQFSAHLQFESLFEWDTEFGGVRAVEIQRLGALRLSSRSLTNPDPELLTQAFLKGVRENGGLSLLPWNEAAISLRERMKAYAQYYPEADVPSLSDQDLLDTIEDWLGLYVQGMNRVSQLEKLDLPEILLARYPMAERKNLDRFLPQYFTLASGRERRVSYDAEGGVFSATVQEFFAFSEAAVTRQSRVPFRYEILSPARRPIQVTKDLDGFWRGTYADVRKELRGRYPKHDWPEDPIQGYARKFKNPARK